MDEELLQSAIDSVSGDFRWAIDGDTIDVPKSSRNVRLFGVDTPETEKSGQPAQPNAELAREVTQRIVDEPGTRLELTGKTDVGGRRDMGVLTRADGSDVSEFLLQQAIAAPTRWSTQEQINAEGAGLMTREVFPHWQTPEEKDIQAEREARGNAWDFDTTRQHGEGVSSAGDFRRSVSRGFEQNRGLLGSFGEAAGQFVGWEGLEKSGHDIADESALAQAVNQAEMPDWESVHSISDVATWLTERVGEQVPNVALMAGGAGVGGAIGKKVVASGLEGLAAKEAAKRLATAGTLGRISGVAAGTYTQAVGDIQSELSEAGIKAPGSAFLWGIPYAGAEALSFETMLGRFFGASARPVAKNMIQAIAKEAGKAIGLSAASEGSTEYLQELMVLTAHAMQDPSFEIFSEQNLKRLKESAIAGAAVGGVFGGLGGAAHGVNYEKPFALTPPPAEGDVLPPDATEPPPPPPVNPQEFGQGSLDLTGGGMNTPPSASTMPDGRPEPPPLGTTAPSATAPTPEEQAIYDAQRQELADENTRRWDRANQDTSPASNPSPYSAEQRSAAWGEVQRLRELIGSVPEGTANSSAHRGLVHQLVAAQQVAYSNWSLPRLEELITKKLDKANSIMERVWSGGFAPEKRASMASLAQLILEEARGFAGLVEQRFGKKIPVDFRENLAARNESVAESTTPQTTPQSTQEQSTQSERLVAPQLAPDGTVIEPQRDIDASIEEARKGTKLAAYVAGQTVSTPDDFETETIVDEDGFPVGTLYFPKERKLRVRQVLKQGGLAAVLGYQKDKSQVDPATETTVSALRSDGAVPSTEVTDAKGLPGAVATAAAQAGENGQVVIAPPEAVLDRRIAETEAEAGLRGVADDTMVDQYGSHIEDRDVDSAADAHLSEGKPADTGQLQRESEQTSPLETEGGSEFRRLLVARLAQAGVSISFEDVNAANIDLIRKVATAPKDISDAELLRQVGAPFLATLLMNSSYSEAVERAYADHPKLVEVKEQLRAETNWRQHYLYRVAIRKLLEDVIVDALRSRVIKVNGRANPQITGGGIRAALTTALGRIRAGASRLLRLLDVGDSLASGFLDGSLQLVAPVKPGYTRVDFAAAFAANPLAASIVKHLAQDKGLMLTGSIAYATQGTVFRNQDRLLHDLDFVSSNTPETDTATLKAAFPGAVETTVIHDSNGVTHTFLVPPAGHTIGNIKRNDRFNRITKYSVLNAAGKVVGTYSLNIKTGKESTTGVEAVYVDFFSGKGAKEFDTEVFTVPLDGAPIRLADFAQAFKSKLKFGRPKDFTDYSQFVPNRMTSDTGQRGAAVEPSQETTDEGQGQEEGRGRQEALLEVGAVGDPAAWDEHGSALLRLYHNYKDQPISELAKRFANSTKETLKRVFPGAENFAQRIGLLKALYDVQFEQNTQEVESEVYDPNATTEREALEPITIRLTRKRAKGGEGPLTSDNVDKITAFLRQMFPNLEVKKVGVDWDFTFNVTNGELAMFAQLDSTTKATERGTGVDARNLEKALNALVNAMATGENKQEMRLTLKSRESAGLLNEDGTPQLKADGTPRLFNEGRFNFQGLIDFGFELLGYHRPDGMAMKDYVGRALTSALGFLDQYFVLPTREVSAQSKKDKSSSGWARTADNGYEVSTRGDARFSALNARLRDGRTIEEAYQLDVKGYRDTSKPNQSWRDGKGKRPKNNKSKEQTWAEYKALWAQFLAENPELAQELREKAAGKVLTDAFASTDVSQARALHELLSERAPSTEAGSSFEIVKLPFGQQAPEGVIDGHRAGDKNVTNAAPGEPGALGNPFIANDVRGGQYTREEAVRLFEQAFLKRVNEDPAYRAWVESLRGKKVGYYKPNEPTIHLHVVQKWLENNAPKKDSGKPRIELAIDGDQEVYKTKSGEGTLTWEDVRPSSRGSELFKLYELLDEEAPGLRTKIAELRAERSAANDEKSKLKSNPPEKLSERRAWNEKLSALSKKGQALTKQLDALYKQRAVLIKKINQDWINKGKQGVASWTNNDVSRDQQQWQRDETGDPTDWLGAKRVAPEYTTWQQDDTVGEDSEDTLPDTEDPGIDAPSEYDDRTPLNEALSTQGEGEYLIADTLAAQNRRSRLDRSARKTRSPEEEDRIEKTREKVSGLTSVDQVRVYGGSSIQHLAKAARAVLAKLGMQTQIILVDDFGIGGENGLLQELDQLAKDAGEEAAAGFRMMAERLRAAYAEGKNGYFISNADNPVTYLRTPIIYVSNDKNKPLSKNPKSVLNWHMGMPQAQITVLAHELGHMIDYALLNQAREMAAKSGDPTLSKEDAARVEEAKELIDALSEARKKLDTNGLSMSEWLANQFVSFVAQTRGMAREFENATRDMRLEGLSGRATKAFERYFGRLFRHLRDLWELLRAKFDLAEPFEQFIRSVMVSADQKRSGSSSAHGEYGRRFARVTNALVTGPTLTLDNSASRVEPFTEPVVRRAKRLIDWASNTTAGKASTTWVKWFHQHVTQSVDSQLRGMGLEWLADDFHHRPDVQGARTVEGIESELNRRVAGWHRRGNDLLRRFSEKKWYDSVLGYKLGHINAQSPLYREVMSALIGHRAAATPEAQQAVTEIRQYFADLRSYLINMGLTVDRRANYFAILYKSGEVSQRMEQFLQVLTTEFGFSAREAKDMAQTIAHTNGTMLSPGVGFGHTRRRALGPRELARLHELGFIEDDLGTVMAAYTRSGIHRAITDRRFGKDVQQDDGTTYREPMGGLYERLNQWKEDRRQAGHDAEREYARVHNVLLPALFGQLGANADPRWKRMQGGAITMQNFRLLAGATLSSMPDPAGIFVRGDWASTKAAIRAMLSKQSRAQLLDMAEMLGIIRDDFTAHALNDTSQDQYLGSKFRIWNENFFRAVQMHRWTNFNRIAALSAGIHFLKSNADRALAGDTKALQSLRELGLTPAEVRAWQADGAIAPPLWGQPVARDHQNVFAALSQFVDESSMRPSASIKPTWGNDQRVAVLFHLKTFVWNFQEVMLRRLWSQIKSEPKYRKLLPVISFAIPYMALAAVGYELRRMLFNLGEPTSEKEGADYWFEVLQRSGGLGVMQLMVDMDEAQDRGRLSLLAVLGPTVSQFEEFLTKSPIDSIPRAIPGLAQSPVLRAWLQNSLDDLGVVDLEPGKYAWNRKALGG
jgi:endonuclease YncB( thermonuclease family)